MKRQNKIFIFYLFLTALMLVGIMTENFRLIQKMEPLSFKQAEKAVGANQLERIKENIKKTGIIPREAKYWKTITEN